MPPAVRQHRHQWHARQAQALTATMPSNADTAALHRPAEDGQRVIARLEDDKHLLRAPGWHEKDIAREWGEVQHAPDMLL